jgi:hypothetical protein
MLVIEKVLGFSSDAGAETVQRMFSGKPIDVQRVDLEKEVLVEEGDWFRCTVDRRWEDGYSEEVVKFSVPITKPLKIDSIVIFEITDDLGFKNAVCGAFGEKG